MRNPKSKIQNPKSQSTIQKYFKILYLNILSLMLVLGFWICSSAQESTEQVAVAETKQEATQQQTETKAEEQTAIVDNLTASQNVTLDFKEADIRNVLKIIAIKTGVNIVTTPDVIGNVTIRLMDVPWEKALNAILKTYSFGYDKQDNIIVVAPIDKLTAQKKQEVELAQVQPTVTEVFNLKYIDAQDAKKALEPQLSPRGKITVLEMTGQAGWEFGTTEMAKRKRITEEKMGRSKVLIISDITPIIDRIKEVIEQIDIMPPQVLIETRIMEVSRDELKDIGFDWGTGSSGAESSTIYPTPAGKMHGGVDTAQQAGHFLTDQITPTVFGPKETTLTTANTGLKVLYKKLTGAQFEVIVHALEEDVNTNTLSAPRVLTLNNQEATILVGTKYPILKSEVSTEAAGQTVSVSLEYYQDIGIQLNVVPQVSANDYINMVVHPAISSYTGTDASITSAKYPVIDVREAETRILMKNNETVVIGGLLKDIKSKEIVGIPFLSKIPLLGIIFRRETVDTQKIDLLIFITARIIKEGEFSSEEIAKLEERLERGTKKAKAVTKKKKNNR